MKEEERDWSGIYIFFLGGHLKVLSLNSMESIKT